MMMMMMKVGGSGDIGEQRKEEKVTRETSDTEGERTQHGVYVCVCAVLSHAASRVSAFCSQLCRSARSGGWRRSGAWTPTRLQGERARQLGCVRASATVWNKSHRSKEEE